MGAWRPAKWKLFSQPNMAFGCVLLFGWDRAANGDPAKNFLFPTQRRRPVTSVRDECDERNSFEDQNLRTTLQSLRQFGCSSHWVAKALRRRENQKKKIFCVACGATDFFFNRSPRGWGGLGRSVYLPFLECVTVLK